MPIPPNHTYTAQEGMDYVTAVLSSIAGERLKQLLEEKHLYQHVVIEDSVLLEMEPHVTAPERARFQAGVKQHFGENLQFIPFEGQLSEGERVSSLHPELTLIVTSVKVYCPKCDSAEVSNPAWYAEINNLIKNRAERDKIPLRYNAGNTQTFVLAYECQRCRAQLQSFIVRREGWKLYLHGRSPMEHIEVPKYIPKPESHLYRDAVIAFNTGKHLAGLFYLRSFIEQFARRLTGISGKETGDTIMDAYNETLPVAQCAQMPSLREWYDKLSEPIHAARDDEDVFKQGREEIERHLDIRRVFKIPEAPPEPQRNPKAEQAAK